MYYKAIRRSDLERRRKQETFKHSLLKFSPSHEKWSQNILVLLFPLGKFQGNTYCPGSLQRGWRFIPVIFNFVHEEELMMFEDRVFNWLNVGQWRAPSSKSLQSLTLTFKWIFIKEDGKETSDWIGSRNQQASNQIFEVTSLDKPEIWKSCLSQTNFTKYPIRRTPFQTEISESSF